MKPQNIFIIRHGQSQGNVDKNIYKTQPDYTLKLTELGIQQAKDAGVKLAKIVNGGRTAFYISPFWRARQTAKYIKQAFHEDQLMFSYEDVRLREQEWGNHIAKEYNEDHELARDSHGHFYWQFPNGESCANTFDRVSDFFNTLYRDFNKFNYPPNTIIVAHGMTMRVFLMRWLHLSVEEFESLANPANGEYYHLALQTDGKYKLVTELKRYESPMCQYKYTE